jgi:hypothetical protein
VKDREPESFIPTCGLGLRNHITLAILTGDELGVRGKTRGRATGLERAAADESRQHARVAPAPPEPAQRRLRRGG